MRIPTVVFACKSDKDEAVDPSSACIMLQKYQVGLVQEDGKDKMRRCLDWMIRAVSRERGKCVVPSHNSDFDLDYR